MDKALRHRVNAARVAIRNQVDFFNQLMGQVASEWKEDDTRVTFADFAISEKLFAELRGSFNTDQFLSEESHPLDETIVLDSKYAWILDPIDGTNNYAVGMPGCAISLALLKDGMPVYGMVYDGSKGELIEGGPGHGVRIDGRKHTLPVRSFDARTGVVALHFPLPDGRARKLQSLLETYRVRSLGSAALHLCYVALGRLDGAIDERVRLWDIAAAVCLLEAVGLGIRYLDGSPFPVNRVEMSGPFIRYIAGNESFLSYVEI